MATTNNSEMGFQLPFERPIARLQRQIRELEEAQESLGRDYASDIHQLRAQYVSLLRKTYEKLSSWETVQVARHPGRPLSSDYIDLIVKQFAEIHGDRRYADDKAVRCGPGRIGTEKVMLIAQQKGKDTKEKIACNFGMMHPEGYRKAERCMRMAAKFHMPIVALMDTAGAYPGIGSEERGVAEAIAHSMMEMSRLQTPIVCIVIGEGGSGGAIGVGIGDRMAMLEYAYYSVISPEGCAAILWRTGEKAPEAAEALGITARRLQTLGVIDDIIPEPLGGAHRTPAEAARNLERYIVSTVRQLKTLDPQALVEQRYQRWRRMGSIVEPVLQTQTQPR